MTARLLSDRAPARTSRREDVTTMALAGWMIIGLFVDAYYHSTDSTLESFWTPWHALFYSGFTATAAWLLWVTLKRRSEGAPLLDSAPLAHRSALIGIVVFALGGIGDAAWHTALGVETSLDALLSPTHLLLWLGMLAITSTPARAAWQDPAGKDDQSFRDFAPVLASLTITTTLVAFFFEYGWLLGNDELPRTRYVPDGGPGELVAALGILGIIVTTIILMAPVVLSARRWTPPFGAFTLLFGVLNVLMTVGFDDDPVGIAPAIIAGLVADTLIRAGRRGTLLATLPPFVLWSAYFLAVGRIDNGIAWPPEIWGGGIVFGVLTGLVMHLGLRLVEPALRR